MCTPHIEVAGRAPSPVPARTVGKGNGQRGGRCYEGGTEGGFSLPAYAEVGPDA